MPTHNSTVVSNSEQFSRLVTVSANKLIVLQVNISNQNVGTALMSFCQNLQISLEMLQKC